jgi:hypothetical protein
MSCKHPLPGMRAPRGVGPVGQPTRAVSLPQHLHSSGCAKVGDVHYLEPLLNRGVDASGHRKCSAIYDCQKDVSKRESREVCQIPDLLVLAAWRVQED